MFRLLLAPGVALLLAVLLAPSSAAASTATLPVPGVSVSMPSTATPGQPFAVTITLPGGIAAVDGRVLYRQGAAEVLGVAPVGAGTAFRPIAVTSGIAFGAFGLHSVSGHTVVRIVLEPSVAGDLQVRVIVDAAADGHGRRVRITSGNRVASTAVMPPPAGSNGPARASRTGDLPFISAPDSTVRFLPARAAGPAGESVVDGVFNRQDLDTVRGAWQRARETGTVCGPARAGDANGDGCVDIVDVQAVLAVQGAATAAPAPAVTGGLTFTVTSDADTADARPGDGVCADSRGYCTLRAAMMEADYLRGDDRIEFNLPGSAPARIQLSSPLPMITSRVGTVTIDGYTQPGSQVNTATVGSNAIPGIEVRGASTSSGNVAFRVTSGGNVIRGLVIDNVWRGIFLDGTAAQNNRVIGNWIGFQRNGTNAGGGYYGIVLNTGANHNIIGTPNLADRNVIGNFNAAIDEYGPGTDANLIQDNQFCIGPSGFTAATCGTGVDHNFGPKNELIGGTGTNERNIIGPTTLQGIEYSHGWNPALPWGTDTATTYQINGNQAVGNWVGFRGDGSYDPAYRSGLNFSSADNGQGINVYDGSNNNIVDGNYIAAVYDGVQVEAPDAQGNIIRNNVIGQSPLGQAAPLTGWGVKVRWGTKHDIVQGNQIHNAAAGGIGLVSTTNRGGPISVAYNIRISRNIVTDTSGPAIYLAFVSGSTTKGANSLVAAPAITGALTSAISGTAAGGATVEVYRASRAVGEFGLPIAYIGSAVAASDGTWTLPVTTLQAGDVITALQIRTDDNTSALSANVAVHAPPPPPASGSVLAADGFSRVVTGGWGTADTGGAWKLAGTAADFGVAAGVASVGVAAAQVREADLNINATDVDMTGRVAFDRLPVGGNAYAYVIARATGTTAYRATIRLAASGALFVQLKDSVNGVEGNLAAEVATGLTATPGSFMAYRFRVVGTHLQFRTWDPSGAEPSAWQTEIADSTAGLGGPGAVGLRAYTGKPVTNGPVTVSLEDFAVLVP